MRYWTAEENSLVLDCLAGGVDVWRAQSLFPDRSYDSIKRKFKTASTDPHFGERRIRVVTSGDWESDARTASEKLIAAIRKHHPSRCETLEAGA